ncbi:MAG: hypothetical protein D8M58_12105 [Calditrichaeota bacterium]|nr:MAG: hypothetical protein DWQ03_12890 [Calditrichota bacterium]MBL1206139.1 hypothetical protein [Calditrichota bacterium]NOG45964.1 hypothetical protein [Calditrichota bacterium]
MKNFILFLILLIILSCSQDKTVSPDLNDEIFIYGLIGTEENLNKPDSSNKWVYIRLFGHLDNTNIQGKVEGSNNSIILHKSINSEEIVFRNHETDNQFDTGKNYSLILENGSNSFSGQSLVLPKIQSSIDTVSNNRLQICWADIDADFYSIRINAYPKIFEFQTSGLVYDLPMDSLLNNQTENEFIKITIAGFKGLISGNNDKGNIEGAHGYIFSYSQQIFLYNLSNGLAKNIFDEDEKQEHIDQVIESIRTENIKINNTGINYLFGYTRVQQDINSLKLNSLVLAEPLNAISNILVKADTLEFGYSPWAGFYQAAFPPTITTQVKHDSMAIDLRINNLSDSTKLKLVTTFSLKSLTINDSSLFPLKINWTDQRNKDYSLIIFSWLTEDLEQIESQIYFSEADFIEINEPLGNSAFVYVEVYAIAGDNPLHGDKATFPELNHYVFSSKRCSNPYLISLATGALSNIPPDFPIKENNLDELIQKKMER